MSKTILALLATLFVLAGCNTIRGAGQDLQKAGQSIEDAARKTTK
jgi:predicted small secreted protein